VLASATAADSVQLDLSGVAFIDTTGLGALLELRSSCAARASTAQSRLPTTRFVKPSRPPDRPPPRVSQQAQHGLRISVENSGRALL
jgi:hypothetical protein